MTPHLEVRRVDAHDEEWVTELMRSRWRDETVVSRGRVRQPATLPGFVVVADLIEPVGLLTYDLVEEQCQVVTIDSLRSGIGVGTMLLDAVVHLARDVRCRRVWLVTTNDNVHAQAWFEAHGLRRVATHAGHELEYAYPIV